MRRAFSRASSYVIAVLVAAVAFLVLAWSASLPLALQILSSLGFEDSSILLRSLLAAGIADAFALESWYAVASILIGINAALFVFFVRMSRAVPTGATGTLIGSTVLLFGIGCAACGSSALVSTLSVLGGTGLLVLLPYGGDEFRFVGLALLFASIILLSRNIDRPPVCPI